MLRPSVSLPSDINRFWNREFTPVEKPETRDSTKVIDGDHVWPERREAVRRLAVYSK